MSVLSGLGGGHVDDLTGSSLDEDVSTLPERGTLSAICQLRYTRISHVRLDTHG